MYLVQNHALLPLTQLDANDQETKNLHSAKLHQLDQTEIVKAIAALLVFIVRLFR